ncbi:MAG: hypothetical protein EXQ92_05885 [Alphaproteobacteria bacterium]|nr:hypothetical protein [Alphaproteobacteria bacterium]
MRRAPEGELKRMRTLCRERYRGVNVKHFREQLEAHHGYKLRYTVTRRAALSGWLVPSLDTGAGP